MSVIFCRLRDTWGEFSNFFPLGFTVNDIYYKTSEHYYQSKKFEGHPDEQDVIDAKGPEKSAQIGRDTSRPLRKDWDLIKDNVMFDALVYKFTAHESLKELLLSTKDEDIVEFSNKDFYWGSGNDFTGLNKLGKLLVMLRQGLVQGMTQEELLEVNRQILSAKINKEV